MTPSAAIVLRGSRIDVPGEEVPSAKERQGKRAARWPAEAPDGTTVLFISPQVVGPPSVIFTWFHKEPGHGTEESIVKVPDALVFLLGLWVE
jgi:hypothetical protein